MTSRSPADWTRVIVRMPFTLVSSPTEPARSIAPLFECECFFAGRDAAWVQASGEFDIVSSPRLERVLDDAQCEARLVVLDLHEVTFMDTFGVHVIASAATFARLSGHRLIVLRTPKVVQDVFDLTGTAGEIDGRRQSISAPLPATAPRGTRPA
jgi:anti-anti-sigma factor